MDQKQPDPTWEPCPDCEGFGEIDYSEEHEVPGSRFQTCWRCGGDKGWPVEPSRESCDDVPCPAQETGPTGGTVSPE